MFTFRIENGLNACRDIFNVHRFEDGALFVFIMNK